MVDMLFRSVKLVLEVSWMISPFGDVIRNTFRKKRTSSSLNFVNVATGASKEMPASRPWQTGEKGLWAPCLERWKGLVCNWFVLHFCVTEPCSFNLRRG